MRSGLVVLLLAAAACSRAGDGPASTVAPTPGSTPDPTATPSASCDAAILDLSFVDRDTGFALAADDGCAVRVVRTRDGGTSWDDATPLASRAAGLTFLDDEVGFAYNPGLVRTPDGGRTWATVDRRAEVLDLAVEGTTLWAVERRCRPACDLVVTTSTDDGATWVEPTGASVEGLVDYVAFAARSRRHAWVLARTADGDVVRTTDDASTWTDAGVACQRPEQPVALAILDGDVSVACEGGPVSGHRSKTIVVRDGDAWATIDADGLGADGQVVAMSSTSKRTAWLVVAMVGVLRSDDGGGTWRRVLREDDGLAFGVPVFVDARRGWTHRFDPGRATAFVHRTVDGGQTWDEVPFR